MKADLLSIHKPYHLDPSSKRQSLNLSTARGSLKQKLPQDMISDREKTSEVRMAVVSWDPAIPTWDLVQ